MPCLYIAAEETSRNGMPTMAATDGHSIDTDLNAPGEFLLGHDLLIAPSPYPEEPDAYTVELPTSEWYDY